jgi:hypothetical protein
MTIEFVSAINRLREAAMNGGWQANDTRLRLEMERILVPFSGTAPVRALFEGLERGRDGTPQLLVTERELPNLIFGFFDVPYNKTAWLEAAAVRSIPVPKRFVAHMGENMARPVVLEACTDAFRDPLAVAVFCENYCGVTPREDYKAYYFIDKFVDRFKSFTLPEIAGRWSPTAFPALHDADNAALYSASATWVSLHEAYHRQGYLPIPEFLYEKSTRNGGGIEEMRVDLLACVKLGRQMTQDPEAQLAFQYILAERLIRYPLQSAPSENYDARASVALFSYLRRKGVIARRGGRLYFEGGSERLLSALLSLAVRITSFEYHLLASNRKVRRTELANVLPWLAMNENRWPANTDDLEQVLHA